MLDSKKSILPLQLYHCIKSAFNTERCIALFLFLTNVKNDHQWGLEPRPLRHIELGIKWNLGTLEHTGCPLLAKIMAQLLPTIPEPTMAIFCSDVIFEDLLTEKIVSGFEPSVSRKTEVKKVSKTSFVVLVVAGLRHAPSFTPPGLLS